VSAPPRAGSPGSSCAGAGTRSGLDRHDVVVRSVLIAVDDAGERGGLARAGGPGHQHPARAASLVMSTIAFGEPQLLDADHLVRGSRGRRRPPAPRCMKMLERKRDSRAQAEGQVELAWILLELVLLRVGQDSSSKILLWSRRATSGASVLSGCSLPSRAAARWFGGDVEAVAGPPFSIIALSSWCRLGHRPTPP